jgi:hypothetical protein
MKKFFVFLTVLLFAGATFAAAQPVSGKKYELGTAVSFSVFKFSGSSDSESILTMPVRFGYYVWKGLEIEPELMLIKFEGSDLTYNLNANLAYNFKTAGKIVPFVLAGAGVGNAFAVGPYMEGGEGLSAFLLNFGAGAKFLFGNSGALRMEYRFTRNRLSDEGVSENLNTHCVLIGVSLFF